MIAALGESMVMNGMASMGVLVSPGLHYDVSLDIQHHLVSHGSHYAYLPVHIHPRATDQLVRKLDFTVSDACRNAKASLWPSCLLQRRY